MNVSGIKYMNIEVYETLLRYMNENEGVRIYVCPYDSIWQYMKVYECKRRLMNVYESVRSYMMVYDCI